MRQVVLLALLIALGYALTRFLFLRRRVPPTTEPQGPGTVIEEMVRDPLCHLYLPRSEAIRQSIRGQVYYFCGPGCLGKFLASQS